MNSSEANLKMANFRIAMSSVPLSYSRLILAYSTWWIIWGAIQVYLLSQLGFDWETSLTDAGVTQIIFAMAGYTINTSMHSYRPSGRNAIYVLGWSIGLAAICVYLQRQTLLRLVDDESYPVFLQHSLVLRGAFGWLMISLIAVLTWMWVYVSEKHESEGRHNEALRLAREAELTTLRQQLQPHFLFNSLNSISALVISQPDEARKMVQQLSEFLRGTIRKDDQVLVTLDDELRHLQLYLDIEKVRFGHRLKTDVQCSTPAREMKLPSLLLQPVVENAIKFGLYDTTGEITISITAREQSNLLEIEVTNPFDEATSVRTGTGFGLSGVQRRLDLLFSRNDLLKTSRANGIFTTVLRIPQAA